MRHRIKAMIAGLSMFTLGAAANVGDDSVHRGNVALESGDFREALRLYQEAEERTADPGRVAFNKAAAYYALNDFRQAENHYRMALDDVEIEKTRRARALYNLGNCLVRQANASDAATLRAAIRCYELCLEGLGDDEGLRRDAAHNLEVAKLLWNAARSAKAEPPPLNEDVRGDEDQRPPEPKKQEPSNSDGDVGRAEAKKEVTGADGNDAKQRVGENNSGQERAVRQPQPAASQAPVVPDTDDVERQTPEDTRQALQFAEERLKQERQRNRMSFTVPEKPSGRDW